jgi:hypothetical protein
MDTSLAATIPRFLADRNSRHPLPLPPILLDIHLRARAARCPAHAAESGRRQVPLAVCRVASDVHSSRHCGTITITFSIRSGQEPSGCLAPQWVRGKRHSVQTSHACHKTARVWDLAKGQLLQTEGRVLHDPELLATGVAQIMPRLAELGYGPGPTEGTRGPLTRAATQAFQRARGLGVDGQLSPELLGIVEKRALSPPFIAWLLCGACCSARQREHRSRALLTVWMPAISRSG